MHVRLLAHPCLERFAAGDGQQVDVLLSAYTCKELGQAVIGAFPAEAEWQELTGPTAGDDIGHEPSNRPG
jgi:hypothetical protein